MKTAYEVFACTLVMRARFRYMSASFVEGFSLQVLPLEHLSLAGIRAGVQAWIRRCFPTVAVPVIALEWPT